MWKCKERWNIQFTLGIKKWSRWVFKECEKQLSIGSVTYSFVFKFQLIAKVVNWFREEGKRNEA